MEVDGTGDECRLDGILQSIPIRGELFQRCSLSGNITQL